MVFNVTIYDVSVNIMVISFIVEETGENPQPVASH
jgi:hypothetical protein